MNAIRPNRWDALGLMGLSLTVNLFHIAERSLVFDEATSVLYARQTLSELAQTLSSDPNMSLYYALLHFWIHVFGESETAVRAPSAILGALAVVATYHVGVQLFGRRAGIAAGLLLALNAFFVQYAQTARSYAMVACVASLSAALFVGQLERPSRRRGVAYVVVAALSIYAHFLLALLLVTHAVSLVAIKGREAFARRWVMSGVAIAVLMVPGVVVASRVGPGAHIGWIQEKTWAELLVVPVELAGGSSALLLALLGAGSYALLSARRQSRWWAHGFVVAWLVLPVVLVFVLSSIQPMFLPNYLIFVVPALALFGASSVNVLPRPLVAALAVPLFWISLIQLGEFYPAASAEHWREATRYVLAAAQPGDAIVFFPAGSQKPFEYYERQRLKQGIKLDRPPRAGNTRVWLVVRNSDVPLNQAAFDTTRAQLTERYRRSGQREFQRVTVELYVRAAE